MARGLSHEFKRVIAGACALMVVTGSVPMQPVADAFNSLAMAASAENFADGLTNGQILHVGDTFTVEDIYAVGESDSGYYLRSDYGKITLVKGNVVFNGAPDFVESDTGMYYAFKTDNRGVLIDCDDQSQTVRTGKFLFEVTHWSDGESDGLSVTRNGNVVNFAVHETKYLSNLYAKATSATYNGDALTPTLTWYKNVGTSDAEIVNLTAGTDYEITAVYKAKEGEQGTAYDPDGDSIGTSATEAGTYLVDIQGKGDYSGDQRIVWTINPADIAALTGVNTTYNGNPQNLVSGTPTQGTVFSLTEPRADYDAEIQRVGALAERAYQAHENAPINGVERDYYLDAWSALSYYKNAISNLKDNDDTNASYCLDDTHAVSYANKVAASTFTPSADMQDVIDYIKTYIKGTDFDKTKARFTAADPVWKSADEITATDAGTYTVWYKYGGNSANYTDKVNSFTATINKAAPNVTGPTFINEDKTLNYTGEAQDLFDAGSVDEKMGTMEYAAATSKIDTDERELTLDDIKVGTIFKPTTETGFKFPENTRVYIIDFGTYANNFSFNYNVSTRRIYLYKGTNTCGAVATFDAFIVDSIQDNGTVNLKGFNTNNLSMNSLDWSTEVPERTDVGKYDVYYRVVSNEKSGNYNEVSPTKFGTVEIKYRTVTAKLLNLDSDDENKPKAKIVEVTDNGEKDVQPNGGIYTLTATKTYKIYTQKTIAGATVDEYLLGCQPLGDGKDYKYCYTFNIPAAAEYDSAAFSHENNWKGAVYTDESDKLYIADGEVNKKTGTLAAILKGENTYYYGDTPTENDVEIQDFAKGIVKVKEIYLENAAGTRVDDLNNVAYGEYKLKAEVEIDADGDTDFETGSQTTQTMYKKVTYAPRPVDKCTTETSYIYYMENEKEHKLDVKTDEKTEEKYIEFPAYTYDGTEKTLPEMFIHTPDDAEKVLLVTNEPTAATKTDAGKYSFTAYPVDDTGAMSLQKAKNYDGTIEIRWQINKAEAKVTVAPKSDIVYDGKQLDINDFEITAVDGDNADALTKEFLATIGAKNSGTTAEVTPAKVETSNEADFTGADGIKINSNNCTEFVGKIINGNISFENAVYSAKIEKEESDNNLVISQSYLDSFSSLIKYQRSLRCLYINDGIIIASAAKGYMLQIDSITLSNSDEYTIKLKAVPAKKTTELTDSDLINASKTDEVKKANVVIKSKNFADIEYVQKFDEDDKDKIVEDKSLEVNIDKRQVTVTPKAGQKITYRDTEMPELEYTYEKAEAESTTGVVAADESLFGTSAQQPSNTVLNALNYVPKKIREVVSDTEPLPVIYVGKFAQSTGEDAAEFVYVKTEEGKTDYSKAVADGIVNNAGKYDYAAGKFDNYTVVFPENADKFTVDRLDLNNIEDLNIVLTGDEQESWVQDGNSGSYTYDGTTKTVKVNKVSKPHEDVTETIETEVSSIARPEEGRRFSLTTPDGTVVEFDQKVRDKNDNNSSIRYIAAGNHEGISYDMAITPIDEKAVKTIKYYDQGDETGKTLTVDGEAGEKVSFKEAYIANGGNWNSLALLRITKLEVTYSFDEYVLEADTDYTVGGSVKSATSGEKTVQVKGKGNYTGVAKAIWEINSAAAGEATLTFKNAEGVFAGEAGREPLAYNHEYDGEAVTGEVKFADPDSTYAENADVEIKYYKGNGAPSEENLLDGKPTDAGEYMVVATITCDGYEDKTLSKFLTIAPAALTVDPEQQTKESITYGDDLPAVTEDDIAAIEGLTDADREYFEQLFENGKLKFVYMKVLKLDDNDNPVTDPTTGGYILEEDTSKITLNPTFDLTSEEGKTFIKAAKNYNVIDFYWNIQTKSKSIKDKSITVEFTGGSAVVLDEEGFAESNSIVVKDTAILDANGEPTVLTQGTDYELNIESTATAGEFTVEIIGQGNYKNIRKETFTAVTSVEELASVEYTKVEIADIAKKQIRVAVKAEPEFEGYEIVKTGLVLWNSAEGEPSGELTLENAEQYDDIKTGSKAASEYSAKIKDNGAGIKVVGYVTLTDGTNTYTIYADEPVETTYDETAMESVSIDYTKVEIADIAKKQIRVAVASEVNTEGFEIVKTGLVLWNSAEGEPSGELTLENAAQYDDIKTGGTAASEYSAKIKDNGAGIKAVGYVTFTDGTNTYTKYCGEIVKTNFDQMMNERN